MRMRAVLLLSSFLGLAACEQLPAPCVDPASCGQAQGPPPSRFGPEDNVVPVQMDPNRVKPVPGLLSVSRTQQRVSLEAQPREQ